jgi:hypothetical protein
MPDPVSKFKPIISIRTTATGGKTGENVVNKKEL